MSEEPRLHTNKPKKAQLKRYQQQQASAPSSMASSGSQAAITSPPPPPPPPPPQPPKESFARRYKFIWPLLLAVNLTVGVNQMANITKLEFAALDITGKNYLSWVLDADIHLVSKGLGETIKEGNKESLQDRAKALIFLRHHLHDGLKIEYLTEKDPHALWKKLTERFDHQRTIVLPKARYEWMHLRLQDFKTVTYFFMRTKKKDVGTEEAESRDVPATPVSTSAASATVTEKTPTPPLVKEPAKLRAPIPEDQQRELFKWILEEKRKVKPKDPEEKKRIDEEKAILKQFIRAKSIPSL